MSDVQYSHSVSTETLFSLLLFQANQFELFKNFVMEILDSKDVISLTDFQDLFEEYSKLNKSKFLHNLLTLEPNLEDMNIQLSLL